MAAQAQTHPIELVVTDDLQRNRLTVFFRLILAIPHLIVYVLWGIAVYVAVLVAWIAGIILGRIPDGLHSFIASWTRYSVRVLAYTNLTADPFPPFGSGGDYPVDCRIAGPEKQSRLTIFFRSILAIPALILMYVLNPVLQILGFLGWFVCLALGRMPEGMRDLQTFCIRWIAQTYGYMFLLTSRYPSLSGGPKA